MSANRKSDGAAAPTLYRPHQVARALGCSEWWIKEQARRRRIPFAWIGGSYRFTDEHLAEIIRLFEVRPWDDPRASTATSARTRRAVVPVVSGRLALSNGTAPVLRARPPRRPPRSPQGSPTA